jgi:ABC-type multidrug transport system fused ATPase/permease subunit
MWRQAKKGALYLYRIQTMRERATFALLICLTTLTAYIEFGLIKAIGPVVALTGTSQGHSTSIAIPPPKFIDFEHHNASDVAAAFMVLALASAGVRIVHVYIGYSYVYRIGHIISSLNLSNALDADYILLKSSHSSVLLARFEKINMVINSVLVPILTTISSVIIGAAIILSLFSRKLRRFCRMLGLIGYVLLADSSNITPCRIKKLRGVKSRSG